MFRHYNVAVHAHLEVPAHTFQALDEKIVDVGIGKEGFPMKTTEGDDMGLA